MPDFAIPHTTPLRFVKTLISTNEQNAQVEIAFEEIPTLGMLIEAAAQSSSGILNQNINGKVGFLVTLKNIKLLSKPSTQSFQISTTLDHKIENYMYFTFSILDKNINIMTGSFVIALLRKKQEV